MRWIGSTRRRMGTVLAAICVSVCASGLSVHAMDAAPGERSPDRAKKEKPVDLKDRIKVVREGSGSKQAQKLAERILATAKMTPANRRRVNAVLKDTAYFRQLPLLEFETDPRTYMHITRHPDVTASLWRAMGISKFKVKQKGPDLFVADAGDGTMGTIEVMYRGPQHHVILCSGMFKSKLLIRSVKTQSVIHMQTIFTRQKNGTIKATHRAFVHVAFPSTAVEAVAKLLSPLGDAILDHNFKEMSLFVHVMTLAMSNKPGWVEYISRKMEGVSDAQRKELLLVTARVYNTARKRRERLAGKPNRVPQSAERPKESGRRR